MKAKGIIAAMQTAFKEDGSINEYELRKQINRQIEAGVDGIFCLGTNGEFYILNEDEKIKVMKIFVDEAQNRVPVYAGTGCIGTKDTINLSQKAEEIGVDVLSIITPFFAQISQDELYYHYNEIAVNVDLPIVMYNIPARTGVKIEPKTVEKLARIKNIIGIKDSSGDFNNILKYIEYTKNMDFSVLSGNDALILWTLLAGGKGGITAISNVLPEIMVDIYRGYIENDLEKAKSAQSSIAPLRECFKYGNPNSIVKCATNLIGQNVGKCREPFGILDKKTEEKIKNVLDTHYKKYMNK